jgi:hypothetical protein
MRFVGVVVCCLAAMVLVVTASPKESSNSARQEPKQSAAPQPAQSPIPDTFVNLQVLPKDITKPQLVNVMKRFAITFGVRCSYCHTVSDDLREGRFDSDDKEPKLKARELLKAIYDTRPIAAKATSAQ